MPSVWQSNSLTLAEHRRCDPEKHGAFRDRIHHASAAHWRQGCRAEVQEGSGCLTPVATAQQRRSLAATTG